MLQTESCSSTDSFALNQQQQTNLTKYAWGWDSDLTPAGFAVQRPPSLCVWSPPHAGQFPLFSSKNLPQCVHLQYSAKASGRQAKARLNLAYFVTKQCLKNCFALVISKPILKSPQYLQLPFNKSMCLLNSPICTACLG